MWLYNPSEQKEVTYLQPFKVLEVILLDLSYLVVLQVQQDSVIWNIFRNFLQT